MVDFSKEDCTSPPRTVGESGDLNSGCASSISINFLIIYRIHYLALKDYLVHNIHNHIDLINHVIHSRLLILPIINPPFSRLEQIELTGALVLLI